MRALVTGGAGFIGSALVDRLVEGGHQVVVIDDLSTGKRSNLGQARGVALHVLDLATDPIDELVAEIRPDVVFHLAAQMDVRKSVADPVRDAMVNVIGTVKLLEASRRAEVQKFIFTSSGGCIYGEPTPSQLPIDESFPGHPHSPYGASKRGVEEYLHTYEILYGLRWTSLALGNVYGARQDPSGEAGVVSIFGGRMLRGEPVALFGDGEQTRDFVFVSDVVDAYMSAIERGDGLRINIGTGEATSVRALYQALAGLTRYEHAPDIRPARVGELQHIALDNRLAARALGWEPTTTLDHGLSVTLEWLKSGDAFS